MLSDIVCQTFQQMQAQASQVANQVASQLALSAHVAKAAQVAQATVQTLNNQQQQQQQLGHQQSVFPHPIAIAPLAGAGGMQHLASVAKNIALANDKAACMSHNGVLPAALNPHSFSPHAGSPPPITIIDPTRS